MYERTSRAEAAAALAMPTRPQVTASQQLVRNIQTRATARGLAGSPLALALPGPLLAALGGGSLGAQPGDPPLDYSPPTMPTLPGDVTAGVDTAGIAIPAALIPILAALGLPITFAGLAALISSRTKWPWQTPPGEGMIAPWTEQERVGELWGQEGTAYPLQLGAGTMGAGQVLGDEVVTSSWNTNPQAPEHGWTFYRLASGKIATYTKTGMLKKWKPIKMLVMNPRNINLRTFTRMDRYLNRIAGSIAKRSKLLKRQ